MGMEEKIVEEAKHLIQTLKNSNAEALDNKVPLSTSVGNITASIVSGRSGDM